jgi:hypothetical protein
MPDFRPSADSIDLLEIEMRDRGSTSQPELARVVRFDTL